MKNISKYLLSAIIAGTFVVPAKLQAGNPDRAGSAGASELLINPYARSSGWAGANSARVRGLEGQFLNVAGLAHTRKTEILFARCSWLGGSGININSFGLSQHVGETGAIGLGIVALDGGDIPITTVDQPEGGLGTYSPLFLNIGLSYSKGFSDNIFGGICLRVISEQISNVAARGVALDAGIQYVAGKYDQMHFGIALRNVGPKMVYKGDGLSFETIILNGTVQGNTQTVEQRAAAFELPSLLNIGGAYDFYLKKDSTGVNKSHRITVAANFRSNSFTSDQFMIGAEYGFKQYLMLRAGYCYEKGITKAETRQTAYTGPTAGVTLELPFGAEKKSSFGVDYSYRFTNPFSGTHTVGIRVNL